MFYANMCGADYEPETVSWSKADRKALLEEKKAILEAKLATISHWIESIDKEKEENDKK